MFSALRSPSMTTSCRKASGGDMSLARACPTHTRTRASGQPCSARTGAASSRCRHQAQRSPGHRVSAPTPPPTSSGSSARKFASPACTWTWKSPSPWARPSPERVRRRCATATRDRGSARTTQRSLRRVLGIRGSVTRWSASSARRSCSGASPPERWTRRCRCRRWCPAANAAPTARAAAARCARAGGASADRRQRRAAAERPAAGADFGFALVHQRLQSVTEEPRDMLDVERRSNRRNSLHGRQLRCRGEHGRTAGLSPISNDGALPASASARAAASRSRTLPLKVLSADGLRFRPAR